MKKHAVKLSKKIDQLIIKHSDLKAGNISAVQKGTILRPVLHDNKALTGGFMLGNVLVHAKFLHDLSVWVY